MGFKRLEWALRLVGEIGELAPREEGRGDGLKAGDGQGYGEYYGDATSESEYPDYATQNSR